MRLGDHLGIKNIANPGSGDEIMESASSEMPAWGALYQSTGSYIILGLSSTPVKIAGWDSQMWTPRIMVPDYTTTNTITLGPGGIEGIQKIAASIYVAATFSTTPAHHIHFWVEYNYGAGYGFNRIWTSQIVYSTGAPSPLEVHKRYVLSCLNSSYLALYVSCTAGPLDFTILGTSFMILERIA